MELSRINQNISFKGSVRKDSPTFGGISAKNLANSDAIKAVKKIVDGSANNLLSDTVERIPKKYLTESGVPVAVSKGKDLVESFVDIGRIPRGIATSIAQNLYERFPDNKLVKQFYNAPFVQKHIGLTSLKNNLGALRGIYKNGTEFLKKAGGDADVAKETVSKGFDKLLNSSMGWGKPSYDTKYERFWVRLVSGFTAANFLGKDFFNKAKMNGKDDREAKRSAREKITQERLANTGEAISQFAFLATFAQLANTKSWVAPVVSAGIGVAFNVISRLALGRKLTRVKTTPTSVQFGSTPQIEDFVQKAKNEQKPDNISAPKRDKKHRLSLKNILIATGASIAAGFALKAGANTKAFKSLKGAFNATSLGTRIKKLQANTFEEAITSVGELQELGGLLKKTGESGLGDDILKSVSNFAEGQKIYAGRRIKTAKLFGKVEVPVSRLYELPLMPLRFLKELVTYPYKMVNTFAQDIAKNTLKKRNIDWEKVKPKDIKNGVSRFCAKLIDTPKSVKKPDIADIENVLFRFRDFKGKYPKTADLEREFGKYVQNIRKLSVNSTTASKISNEKLVIPAQILSMLGGIFFNMNDDYNQTITLGGTREQAQKDARLRGMNKFVRVAVQATIAGTLNGMFAKYYNSSLLKAGLITAGATVATDTACRVLTGMPFKRMSKEELIQHKKNKEKGINEKYFRMVDRAVS